MLEKAWVAVGAVVFIVTFCGGWNRKLRWYLFPLMPWIARSWFLLEPAKEMRFFSAAIEALRGNDGSNTWRFVHPLALMFALSCFAPVLAAGSFADFCNAAAFAVAMTLSLGYWGYYREDLSKQIAVADQMLLVFTVLAWVYKFAYGYQLGLSPLLVRGGGVYASNQYISIAICLLPFVRNRWILLAALFTMLLQFSRGGYVAIFFTVLLSAFRHDELANLRALGKLINLRALLYGGAAVVGGVVLLALVAPDGFKFLLIRLVGGGAFGLNLEIADAVARLPLSELLTLASESAKDDDRGLIWSTAIRIATDHHLVGVGAGNFVVAASTLNAELMYSNAHNLYLTLLSELGFASLLLFLLLLCVYAIRGWRYSSSGFVAVCTFALYGMFSGQIYETSSEVSISQFIVLLYVFANIDSDKDKKGDPECPH